MRPRFAAAAVLVLVALAGIATAAEPEPEFTPPPDLEEGWYARIETSFGRILVRLLPDQAPQSVAYFAGLAEGTLEWVDPVSGVASKGHYYDGVPVYLAKANQRFETGDRSGTGRGAPRMYVPEEGAGPINFHGPYRMGMTRGSGAKISAVQFFITVATQPWLTGRHPCFGIVVQGRDVVDRICSVKTYSNGRPIEPVTIERVRTFAVGDPAPLAEPAPYLPRPLEFRLREDKKSRPEPAPKGEGY